MVEEGPISPFQTRLKPAGGRGKKRKPSSERSRRKRGGDQGGQKAAVAFLHTISRGNNEVAFLTFKKRVQAHISHTRGWKERKPRGTSELERKRTKTNGR